MTSDSNRPSEAASKVYLVVEDDWESHTVLHASLNKEWAERKALELDAPHAVRRMKDHCTLCITVEEYELEGMNP